MGYLKNEQSLQGCEAYFYDLAEAFAEIAVTDMENCITNKWRKPLPV